MGLLNAFGRVFDTELPVLDSMDEYIDFVIFNPNTGIRKLSQDLYEEENYLQTRWLEVKEDDDFHEEVLHIFNPEGEYLYSVDGNVTQGSWRILERSNTFILQIGSKIELFDLVFLNPTFFILKKHGDQQRKGNPKYLLLGMEGAVKGLEWRQVIESIYNIYRGNIGWMIAIVITLVVIVIFVLLSTI